MNSFKIEKEKLIDSVTVSEIKNDDQRYRQLLTKWSNKDYIDRFHLQWPFDTQFFHTFSYFGSISFDNLREGLRMLKKRAIRENIQYIETWLRLS